MTERIFGLTWEQIQALQSKKGGARPKVDVSKTGDYGSDPLGNGLFRMVPSGEIVDLTERNKRLNVKTNPRPRLGTAKPRRVSGATGLRPSPRLVARRLKNTRKGVFPNPAERFTAAHLEALRREFSKIKRIDPSGETYPKMTALLDSLDSARLKQIKDAGIPWLTGMANVRLSRRKAVKTNPASDYPYMVETRGHARDTRKIARFKTHAEAVAFATAYANKHNKAMQVRSL